MEHSGGNHWRGGRGGRGGRCRRGRRGGRGEKRYHDDHQEDEGGGRGRGERPPPGLRGREIGMWYAHRSRGQTKDRERKNRTSVQMDQQKEHHISRLLANIRATENVPAQPTGRYRDPEEISGQHENRQKEIHGEVPDNWDSVSDGGNNSPDPGCYKQTSEVSYEQGSDAWNSSCNNRQSVSRTRESGMNFSGSLSEWDRGAGSGATNRSHGQSLYSQSHEQQRYGGGSNELHKNPSDPCDQPTGLHHRISGSHDRTSGSCDRSSGSHDQLHKSSRSAACLWDDAASDGDSDWSDEDDALLAAEAVQRSENVGAVDEMDLDAEEGADYGETSMLQLSDIDADFMTEFELHKHSAHGSMAGMNENTMSNFIRDSNLDAHLLDDLKSHEQNDIKFQRMMKFRQKLPSYNMKQELVQLIVSNQVVVISGETGCGKTTQVPQFILDDYISRSDGSLCRVVCTQPRRISAISVAERVADERGVTCGNNSSIGFQIRLESKLPRKQGSILYCTTGILLKWLVSDPLLTQMTHIVLDEVHERDLQVDFLMVVLKDVLPRRPDLKLILMSATLNATMFSQYFWNCPMINIPGFTFPVTEYLLENVIELTKYGHHHPLPEARRGAHRQYGKQRRDEGDKVAELNHWVNTLPGRFSSKTRDVLRKLGSQDEEVNIDLIAVLIEHIMRNKPAGAILVFLPGWAEISKLNTLLAENVLFKGNSVIIPLHSLMPTVNQKQVFDHPPPGIRKIVLATNIAETSITIDDVVYVVDCGKIKMKNFDAENNLATLKAQWVSRANSSQRRGRAGRVQPGECYHLYSGWDEQRLQDYQLPEILRTRLEELCLQIKLLKLGAILSFVSRAMQPPSLQALELSIQLLKDLNALDTAEELTPLGYHLAKMPVDPHTGKMLLFAALFCCLDPILTIAASLSFKDAFYIPMGKEKLADKKRQELSGGSHSDHLMLAEAFKGWERAKSRGTASQYCWDNFLSVNTLRLLADMRRQFTILLHDMKFLSSTDPKHCDSNVNSKNEQVVKAVICAGLYPNVAKIKMAGKPNSRRPIKLYSSTERSLSVHPKSVNSELRDFTSPWFVYHLKMKTALVYLYDCTMVSPYPLLFFGGRIEVRSDQGEDCIAVDDWIVFKASKRIAHLVKELRSELDKLLHHKVTNPGPSTINRCTKDGALMHAIIDLIASEPAPTASVGQGGEHGWQNHRPGGRDTKSWERGRRH